MVRCKLPQSRKGEASYSEVKKVIKVVRPYTVILEDNSMWNARKLVRFKKMEVSSPQEGK
jgi:hypothetical protein